MNTDNIKILTHKLLLETYCSLLEQEVLYQSDAMRWAKLKEVEDEVLRRMSYCNLNPKPIDFKYNPPLDYTD
jgi:hypothetical protein